jgi:hypothetical protein
VLLLRLLLRLLLLLRLSQEDQGASIPALRAAGSTPHFRR